MKRFLTIALGLLITCSGCTSLPRNDVVVGRTVGEILKAENVSFEDCRPGDEPAGVLSKVTYFSTRTQKVVTLHTAPYPLEADPWVPQKAKVLAITHAEPEVTILAVDENGAPVSGARILGTRDQVLGVTDFDGSFRLTVQNAEMVNVDVTSENYERGHVFFSPLQAQAVALLIASRPDDWRKAMESIRYGRDDLHNAYGFFVYHGCKDAVPFLIERLERERPAEGQTRVICTAVHCLEALQMQTGKDFRWDAQAWRNWWETEGKGLPESHFNARRRCEERERRWKQQHAAHATTPLPASEDQKPEEVVPSAP